jgi:hypothetical protein
MIELHDPFVMITFEGSEKSRTQAKKIAPAGGADFRRCLRRPATSPQANNARTAVDANLSLLSPEQDMQILRDAGFRSAELFYAAFTWRGWIAYA